jgi:hypothetical protein
MQVLYVVEFDITSADVGEDAVDITGLVKEHLLAWLTRGLNVSTSVDVLDRDGEMELGPMHGDERRASWEATGAGDTFATRLEVRQPIAATGAEFVTRVTVGEVAGKTTLRVSLARDTASVWLSPVDPSELHQPGLVTSVALDRRLVLRTHGHVQDSQYLLVRTGEEARAVAKTLRTSTRLPVFLLHAREPSTWETAKTLASRLVGLVRVVVVNYQMAQIIRQQFPAVAVPYAGGRLVWSDPNAGQIEYPMARVLALGEEGLRRDLMNRLAGLSVIARGADATFRDARVAAQRTVFREVEERLAKAHASGDLQARVDALEAALEGKKAESAFWEAQALAEEAEAGRYRTLAATAEQAERDVKYWRDQYQDAMSTRPESLADPWQVVPSLEPRSADATFRHLEDISEGHIVFTEAAASSWARSKYPYPEEMAEQLTRLARASVTLYDGSERKMGHLGTWFKTEIGLNVSMNDDTIEKDRSLRYFDYDGGRWDQTPHVKVRDAVKPNEVGRIHFALDSSEGRFIVNHVALKLYGV